MIYGNQQVKPFENLKVWISAFSVFLYFEISLGSSCFEVFYHDNPDAVVSSYLNSNLVMSQDTLNRIIDSKLPKNPKIHMGQFQTTVIRVAMEIPEHVTSVTQFPTALVQLLNLADNSSDRLKPYSDLYMGTERGRYIIFQIDSKGEPDFYIPPRDSVNYQTRPLTEINREQFGKILIAIHRENPRLLLPFVGILNPQIIDVYSSEELGIPKAANFKLHAVWGTSEKPPGQSAVFVRRHGISDGEVWKIKVDDDTGFPMNYRPVKK